MATCTRYGTARCFNAENYFLHANDTPGNIAKKPRSTVNEFGVSVGGPIRKNKLFFFGHYEGIRIALPLVSQVTLALSRISAICARTACRRRHRSRHGHHAPGPARRDSVLPEDVLAVTRRRRITGPRSIGCPARHATADGCANQRQASLNNSDSENLIVVKIDHTINAKDSVWYRFQQDTGLQAAYTDPINSIFNSYSPQPQRTLVVGYTHVFSPTAGEPVQSRRELVLEHL